MKTKFFFVALLALWAMCLPNQASAGLPEAVSYLKSQTPNAWITQALIAAGETNAPTDHLKSVAAGGFNPTNDYAKTILALAAAGKNPATFGEIDFVAKLKTYYEGAQMGDAALLNDDIWSLLALASVKRVKANEAVAAKNFLLANQNADGGWGWKVGGSSGSNDTAAAIMALMEAGISEQSAAITRAIDFLHTMQNDDGGFMNDPAWGTASDSGSDAWVISAIYRVGQDPTAWVKNGNNPLAHLRSLQDSADGGFWWVNPDTNPAFNDKSMTAYAVIALAGKGFPVGHYKLPQSTRLSVNKSALTLGENLAITVEYLDDPIWSPLAGAIVKGLNQDYIADGNGQVNIIYRVGEYSLSAVKEGFLASEPVKVSIVNPSPAPAPAPAPAPTSSSGSSGGSIISTAPTYCQSVEYDAWQNTCVDSWQYRNVLTTTPVNCTLTAEQESQRKKTCVAPEVLGIKVVPEVLGVKIASSSDDESDKFAVEASGLVGAPADDFAAAGTESTAKLGAGERAGVLNSYKLSFNKAPKTQAEWADVIRISNNQLPLATSSAAEKKAKMEFKKVYKREADMKNINDKKAIDMMAYGLRPEKRDLNLERAAIRSFVRIYKHLPASALNWDTVRAIAYSGVGL